MAAASTRTPEDVRREIESERAELARAVESLRATIGGVTAGKLRARLPVVAGGALAAGFVVAGGLGATMRLVVRRGREGRTVARIGHFSLVDRG
jgi:hypothetical protein